MGTTLNNRLRIAAQFTAQLLLESAAAGLAALIGLAAGGTGGAGDVLLGDSNGTLAAGALTAAGLNGPPVPADVITWNGGAQSFVQGYRGVPTETHNSIANVTYYTPGTNPTELITPANGSATAVFGVPAEGPPGGMMPMVKTADTSHDFYKPMSEFKSPPGPKGHSKIFVPNGRPGRGGLNPGGRCEVSTMAIGWAVRTAMVRSGSRAVSSRGGRAAFPADKIGAKGCEIPQGDPPSGARAHQWNFGGSQPKGPVN